MSKRCSFSSCHERGTKKNKILSPHEESNLRPSDSALRCSDESEGLILKVRFLVGSQNFFLCPTLVTRRKKNIFSVFTELKKLTISLISIYKRNIICCRNNIISNLNKNSSICLCCSTTRSFKCGFFLSFLFLLKTLTSNGKS